MRQITRDSVNAFINDRKFNKQNMSVRVGMDKTGLYLHGNLIAYKTREGEIHISMAGWGSVTTRERLNGLLFQLDIQVCVFQKNWSQFMTVGSWKNSNAVDLPMDTDKFYQLASVIVSGQFY